jgi:hypothetical protein
MERLKHEIEFAAFGGWDAYGAFYRCRTSTFPRK